MIVILQLVRSLSECCLPFSLARSAPLSLPAPPLLPLPHPPLRLPPPPRSPHHPSPRRASTHAPPTPVTRFLPMYVLRECMPTHQAAQRAANQTGQPTVRILIKLSVTPEQRAQRAREEERGQRYAAQEDIRLSCYVPAPASIAPVDKAFIPSTILLQGVGMLKEIFIYTSRTSAGPALV